MIAWQPWVDKSVVRGCLGLVAALLALTFSAVLACADTRVALVIGNASYKNTSALTNTGNDARAIAAKLTGIGFEVALYEDLDGQAFREALGEFSEKAQNADLALVYYAGHGIEMGGQNYLIPVDAKMRSEATAAFETVPLEQVLGAVRQAKSLGLVMLDACRNNPFASSMKRSNGNRAVSRGLAPVSVEGERGLIVSFAAEAGKTADDGASDHSPYAAALLEVLDQPGLEVGRMFRSVRAKVNEATKGQQVPIEQMQLPDSEIYLVPAVATPALATVPDASTEPTADPMVIFLSAVQSGDKAQLESFLAHFPAHEKAAEARRILLDYADDDLWNAALTRDTARDYRVYLMAFPTGRHLSEAQAKLDTLEKPEIPADEPAEPQAPQFQYFGNLDLVGGDLTATGIRGIAMDVCQAQCAADASCVAFTYVEDKQWCWTKGSIGARDVHPGLISAIKTGTAENVPAAPATPAPAAPAPATIVLYPNLDILGHDLTESGIKGISLTECEALCIKNDNCSAFSYVKRKQWCWPKYGSGATASKAGIVSGRKE